MVAATVVAVAFLSSAGVAAAAGQNDNQDNASATEAGSVLAAAQTRNFSISNPNGVATLSYTVAGSTHVVKFDTKDAGIPGDRWQVGVQRSSGGAVIFGPCGSGKTNKWSGKLSVLLSPGTYRVGVSWCGGPGVFPAGGKLRAT
jgi:hypothetical protein